MGAWCLRRVRLTAWRNEKTQRPLTEIGNQERETSGMKDVNGVCTFAELDGEAALA